MKYTTLYKEIKKHQPKGLRGIIRNAALSGLALKEKLSGMEKHLSKPRVQFLYIHHVFEDEEKNFEKLLQTLQKQHNFISYSEAIQRVINGEIDKPYIALSSDDGFKNNLQAAKIAEKYGASICFFINPAVIGLNDFDLIKQHCTTRLNFPPVEFLNWNDVTELMSKGHEMGSHTMHHINIAKSTKEEIETDMAASYSILKEKCGGIKHFAFPYGRVFHFSKEGKSACFEAGFETCASAERGCHIPSIEPLSKNDFYIRRDHIILDWSLSHILYFLANNAKRANSANNYFPESLT